VGLAALRGLRGFRGVVFPRTENVLDPTLLSSISDLDLVARIVVEGLVSGLHRSPFHGYSAEFSQYRQYRPGDDLKYLDWKLLARTDRPYTKQFRETTNMSAAVVLDCSASMGFAFGGAPSKFVYARALAAALCHLIGGQGDAVGLLASDEGGPVYVAPKAGRAHLRSLLGHLARLAPAGAWAADRSLARAADLLKRRGLLLVFSDFYDDEERTFGELKRAARMAHEVALFQVVTRAEIDFPYSRERRFEDLESGEARIVDPATVARAYREGFAAFLERWRTRARAEGIDYTLVATDAPPAEALRGYLLRRAVR
jgi:uncharacterized protein (DUF58 family)